MTSPSHEKTEKQATAPAESSIPNTAPQLDNPVQESPKEENPKPAAETATENGNASGERPPSKESPVESPAKDNRRTSFFGNIGTKKEKKGNNSDSENADGDAKPKNKLGSIFRKPSKAVKSENKQKEKATTPSSSEAKSSEPAIKEAAENKEAEAAADKETAVESKDKAPAETPKTEEASKPNESEAGSAAPTAAPVQAAA